MSEHLIYTGDGRRLAINVPDEAVEAAEDWARQDIDIALAMAAPFIIAAELERFAAQQREVLHRLPEYTRGSLAWSLMNDIDARIAELRGA